MANRTARLDYKPGAGGSIITLGSSVRPVSLAATALPPTVAPAAPKLKGYHWSKIVKALLLRVSAEALAKRVARSPKTVRLWEKGTRQPEAGVQNELVAAYRKLMDAEPPKHDEG